MSFVRQLSLLTAVGLCSLPSLEASVQVNHVENLKASFTRVAVLPPACPANVDCVEFERAIFLQLVQRLGPRVIGPSIVHQLMFDLQANEITDDFKRELTKRYDADAFLIASVPDVQRQATGSVGYGSGARWSNSIWGMFGAANIERSSGDVQIAIIRASDGKLLMRGTGFAESQRRSLNGVLASVASEIFERAFFVSEDR